MVSTIATTDRELGLVPEQLFIGGEWREAASGQRFAVHDPATGEVLRSVADATPADGAAALDAADAAFAVWRNWPPRERAELLRRTYDLLQEHSEHLARVATLEMGKPLAEARAEVAYAAGYFRWFSEEAVRVGGRTAVDEVGNTILTLKEPVGPSIIVTPWNFPLAMGARKIAPALAAGCTCVVKPAEQTPLSTLALVSLLAEAGLPEGAVNVVPTTAAGPVIEPLLGDPRARKLSFTGSTAVGRHLLALAANQVLRVSMELGGNAPFVVFDDADLELALDAAVVAKMRNGGEACTAANRFLVHEGIADEFTDGLAKRLGALEVGRGLDPASDVGPLIDERQRNRVEGLIHDAVASGASCLTGGHRMPGNGYFFLPTVLKDVTPEMRIWREEIFGPVAPVTTFRDGADVAELANDVEHGLAAYVFTRDVQRALAVTARLASGMVALNRGTISNVAAPFGGVKQSGVGREGGTEGIEEYLETKYVALP